jgi:predicted transcriptional regulator of viral defense system
VRYGKLIRIRRGIYVKNQQYDHQELATQINTPSYISFETVLAQDGLIFQHYETIFIASYLTRVIIIDGQKYSFVRVKPTILTNTIGINHSSGIPTATRERAFLDRLFVSDACHLDHLTLDWQKIWEILPIYENTRLTKTVEKYHRECTSA